LRSDRVEELAADRQAKVGHLQQQPPGGVQPDVHVAGAVQMRVVDQALPARGRARLLEVDAHRDTELVAQLLSLCCKPLGVVDRGLGVVDAAGPHDDEQPIVAAVEDRLDLTSMGEDRVLTVGSERQVLEDLRRRDQLDDALDPPVSNTV
jgi:hypothetical protein